MIPYTDFAYFGLVAVFALPALIARALGRDARLWILAACAVMLAVQFVGERQQLVSLGLFAAVQVLTVFGFQRICRMTPTRDRRRWAFYAAIALVLLPLVLCRVLPYFEKHFTFGFLGLSYVTFRSLDVIFGLNDGLIASVEGPQLLAFLFFFPTISSGPIDRYRRFGKDWAATADRAAVLPDIDGAVQHLFRGLFYKFIVAWAVKQYWLDPAAAAPGALAMVSYMYAYSAFLFFDFAGYSAFAVGAGMLFGIHTPENFDRPFLAPNIRDFWTRWHISLSTWFRDHVYMRFVITAARGKWFRDSHIASHVGYILTFGLMGLWHGFAVNFLIYGLYHALLLIGYDIFKRWNQKRRLLGDGPFAKTFSTLATAQAVCFGFLIFSGHLNLGPTTAHPKVKAGLHASATRAHAAKHG